MRELLARVIIMGSAVKIGKNRVKRLTTGRIE